MITRNNYYDEINNIRVSKLPDTLKLSREFVDEATNYGKDWTHYDSDKEIKETIDLYFEKLNAFVKGNEVATKSDKSTVKKKIAKKHSKLTKSTHRPSKKRSPSPKQASKAKAQKPTANAKLINSFQDEIQLIRRVVNMDGKEKTKHQILLFINAIQRKITEKKIRKSSPYAKQIQFIQEWLIKLYNGMANKVKVEISASKLTEFSKLLGETQIRPSVKLIRRYINLHGKQVEHKRVKSLHNAIANAINKGKIKKSDQYYSQLMKIIESLRTFNCEVGKKSHLQIHHQTLRGLQGILDGCNCQDELGSLEATTQNRIINSQDIQNLEFERLGFQGQWLDLIGDPSPGFTAMIFGKPKMGKSYLAVDFAGYLAEHHGRVLYVAKEERINATIQEKINEMAVAHPDLDFSDFLPSDLKGYDFVFLDSVNKLHLSPEDLDELRSQYPKTSFIFIFQTTKGGNFRGRNDFQHDVDLVIELPEKGRAVQFGRFNQGGEMEIF